MKKLFFTCLLCLVGTIANAQSFSKQEMTSFLQEYLKSSEVRARFINLYRLPKDRASVLTDSISRMADEPRYIEYLVDQLVQFGLDDRNQFKNDKNVQLKLYLIAQKIQEYLYKKGLQKAPISDLLIFFDYQIMISEALPMQKSTN